MSKTLAVLKRAEGFIGISPASMSIMSTNERIPPGAIALIHDAKIGDRFRERRAQRR